MMVFDVFSTVGTFSVEIDGVLIFLIRIEAIASWTKASNGHYVKKGGVTIPQGSWKLLVLLSQKYKVVTSMFINKEDQTSTAKLNHKFP